jgi:5-methylthioadenosine/S-adenosylhomocysteine deaminase
MPEPAAPVPVDLVVTADWVVPCDPAMTRIQDGAVAVKDGRIAAVGGASEILDRFAGGERIDLGNQLLMPGLVNSHTHATMSLLRGIGDDLPLQRWLFDVIFPAEAALVKPDAVYHGTLLSVAEMLTGGTTTFCDGYFFEEEAARAVVDAGARAVLGQGILDFPSPDQPEPAKARERAEAFLAAFPRGCDRVRPSLFCHAPYTCSAETLQWVKDLCREHGILFQIHLSETSKEVEDIQAQHGERPAFYLDRLGILDSMTLCAHGVWLDDAEIELLAGRDTAITHCVESTMKLAAGITPVPRMLAAGLTVGLGTDGAASNNDLDLFAEMDKAAKLHKAVSGDPTTAPAEKILAAATAGSARAMGLGAEVGSLEPGKRADLVAVDLDRPHLTPLYDPVSHLVYAVRASDVSRVWVDGKEVVRDSSLLTLEVHECMKRANGLRHTP